MGAPPFSFGSDTWPGLAKIVEEAGETQQVIGKFLATGGAAGPEVRHWDGTDLRARLEDELADLTAAVEFTVEHNGLDAHRMAARTNRKRAVFEGWDHEHADRPDTVEPDTADGSPLDPDARQVSALADALYGLEWQASLYDTPRSRTTERYEDRARRLLASGALPTATVDPSVDPSDTAA